MVGDAMAKAIDFDVISLKLSSIFRPSAAIDREELFFGRITQVRQVIDAINQPGQHAIIFGERGVGKTSLGQILKAKLKTINAVPIFSPLVTCNSSDDYTTIWQRAIEEVSPESYHRVICFIRTTKTTRKNRN
jgi:hypothetical protein